MEQKSDCACPFCKQTVTPADGLTATEHLARGILGVYAEMQGMGETDNVLPCPRCGEPTMSTNVLQNALSRYFDICVCDDCGNQEAVAWARNENHSLESWWAVSAILGERDLS